MLTPSYTNPRTANSDHPNKYSMTYPFLYFLPNVQTWSPYGSKDIAKYVQKGCVPPLLHSAIFDTLNPFTETIFF